MRIGALRVQDLHLAGFTNAVANLARVHPDGELLRQVLEDVLDGYAALLGGALEDRVDGIAGLETSEG